jgi:H+/Cl- antiporter ClcA
MIRQERRYAVMVLLFVHMASSRQLSRHAYAFNAWSPVHRPQHKHSGFLIGDRTRLGTRAKMSAILRGPFSSCTVLKSAEANEGAELETISSADELPDLPDPEAGRIRSELYALLIATFVGVMAGFSVGLFKLSIEAVRHISYGSPVSLYFLPIIPAFGGVAVWLLSLAGAFPPGLKDTVLEVDNDSRQAAQGVPNKGQKSFGFLRKALASVFTLGTGSSLGPEGPSVEIGMAMGRIGTNIFPPVELFFGKTSPTESELIQRNRLLLSCGAAAGVSAGFNAPLSGVFFALEIVEAAFGEASKTSQNGGTEGALDQRTAQGSSSITSILLASVLSALVSHAILGNHLALTVSDYTLRTPLLELPLYLLLGATSGVVAFAFSQTAKAARDLFDGEVGPEGLRNVAKNLPNGAKPVIGGLLCGLIGLVFPQILFFGYETLNSLLAKSSLPTMTLLSLLVVKTIATALAAGSGLVGGTFAPSLFLGAMTGAAFHNIVDSVLVVPGSITGYSMQLADVPAYAMVGAASVLAALFRAPLTASLLLFELTRDYDVILPLMASAGVGSLIGDIIEAKVGREQVVDLRRDKDPVSWGDLASRKKKETVD